MGELIGGVRDIALGDELFLPSRQVVVGVFGDCVLTHVDVIERGNIALWILVHPAPFIVNPVVRILSIEVLPTRCPRVRPPIIPILPSPLTIEGLPIFPPHHIVHSLRIPRIHNILRSPKQDILDPIRVISIINSPGARIDRGIAKFQSSLRKCPLQPLIPHPYLEEEPHERCFKKDSPEQ